MSEGHQFSLRTLLLTIAIIGPLLGFLVWLPHGMREADRSAYRSAFLRGEISRESARDVLGDEVDSLVPPVPDNPGLD